MTNEIDSLQASCHIGCRGICTTPDSGYLYADNPYYTPSQPSVGDDISIYATLSNAWPQPTTAAICVFDVVKRTCLNNSSFIPLAAYPLPYHSTLVGPIYIGKMPNHPWLIQVAPYQERIPNLAYDCGQFHNITIEPYCGTGWGCGPSGYCECGQGTYPDSTCGGACLGTKTCDTTVNMDILGLCAPRPMVFIGALLIAVYMYTKQQR